MSSVNCKGHVSQLSMIGVRSGVLFLSYVTSGVHVHVTRRGVYNHNLAKNKLMWVKL